MRRLYFISFYSLLNFLTQYQISSISAYTITPPKSIKDGEILSSQSEIFDLGFFSPPNSKNRYLGVWYRKIPDQTIVWVANRDSPLNDSSGVLTLSTEGNLVILSQSNHLIWSTNLSKTTENPIVEFLDSGNLVLRNRNSDGYLWQSFDHPSDTLLPGMKLGWDLRIGLNRYLTSWKSVDDPSIGDYTYGVVLTGDPEPFIKNGSNKYYRSGPFNGIRNSGAPDLRNNSIFVYNVTITETEVFYIFQLVNQSVFSRLILTQTGNDGSLRRFTWVDEKQSWILHVPIPRDRCDAYGLCGPGSTCGTNDIPVCQCIKGFKPKSPQDWDLMDFSRGCERKTQLACDEGEWSPECERGMQLDCDERSGFMKLREVKLPDTMRTWVNRRMSLEECKVKCSKNCSCMAYANADIREGGSGCVMWFGDLLDIRNILGAGQDLYVRMATSELEAGMPKQNRSGASEGKKPIKVIITISAISSFFLLGAGTYFIMRKKIMQRTQEDSTKERGLKRNIQDGSYTEGFMHSKRDYQGEKDDLELNLFNMDTIVKATDNFSDISMLGKGGFGCVYKGTLEDGQEIAVKRLSKNSGQGEDEFKNEVMLIARLQHRNLVRLLGFCTEKGEKMLIYEYLQNKSLDAILFDRAHNFILDWKKRFNIISGISRGLLYLHQDSRFRIIHRDLKASNVLLDGEMNPKISDFGMARIFGGDDTEAKTKRVMGTYGYMSPEYAMDGVFSVKSDVFSFGVLVLEIISGKKNKAFFSANNQLNLLGYVWTLWNEGNALEVIDETVHDSFLPNEALRCIQVGLLCVQECAGDRPTMSSVVFMLNTDNVNLPQPRQPGFCFIRSPNEADSTSSKPKLCSGDVTVTTVEARFAVDWLKMLQSSLFDVWFKVLRPNNQE